MASRFASEDFPEGQRRRMWSEFLARLRLASDPIDDADFYASAHAQTSALGISFTRVSCSGQRIVRPALPSCSDVLVIAQLDGVMQLAGRSCIGPLKTGDILIANGRDEFAQSAAQSFRQLIVTLPNDALGHRMTFSDDCMILTSQGATGRIIFGMLVAVSETVETARPRDLQPVEAALVEFVLAAALRDDDGAAVVPALQRLSRDLERFLADPELTLPKFAARQGLSVRAIQKVFEAGGSSFTSHIRARRLSRCHADLTDPKLAHLSISELGYRWGFNELAHFSRTFRSRYGLSPRQHREEAARKALAAVSSDVSQRGWPKHALEAAQHLTPQNGDKDADRTPAPERNAVHYLPATADNVHWGYFSRELAPVLTVRSGDVVTIETLTQHAYDDYDRMIRGDPAMEDVFRWTASGKTIDRRGAGPLDASVFGRGAGEGFGVHILTGPIAVEGAEAGDVLEIEILDIAPRPSANPVYAGRYFGSNVAAWWGFQYNELLTEPWPREVVTIYEVDFDREPARARAVYSYRWSPQTDPYGVVHRTIDYPGLPVDLGSIEIRRDVLRGATVPVRPHFGVLGVAPREAGLIDSVPPAYFGGNLDNWRLGKGAKLYLPVSVPKALLSIGDPHASQGDAELSGTGIECSLTGTFCIRLHKKAELARRPIMDLSSPLIETQTEWVLIGFSYPNYLIELGNKAQSGIYESSSLDLAMKDAFRKARRFLMTAHGLSEDEAISLMSVAVDFGISQVVDGNWAIHAIVRKDLFDETSSGEDGKPEADRP